MLQGPERLPNAMEKGPEAQGGEERETALASELSSTPSGLGMCPPKPLQRAAEGRKGPRDQEARPRSDLLPEAGGRVPFRRH